MATQRAFHLFNNNLAETESSLSRNATAVRIAAKNGDENLVRELLSRTGDKYLATEALQGAAEGGHIMLVRHCVSWGGNLNFGLASATRSQQFEVMNELLLMGANVKTAYAAASLLEDKYLKQNLIQEIDKLTGKDTCLTAKMQP